jgi:hypothetical protein
MDGNAWRQIRTCESWILYIVLTLCKELQGQFAIYTVYLIPKHYNLQVIKRIFKGTASSTGYYNSTDTSAKLRRNFSPHTPPSWHCVKNYKVNFLFTRWTNIPDGVNMKQGCKAGDNISWLTRVYTGLFETAIGLRVTQILAFLQTRFLREYSLNKIHFRAFWLWSVASCCTSHYVSEFVVYFKFSVAMLRLYSVEWHDEWWMMKRKGFGRKRS